MRDKIQWLWLTKMFMINYNRHTHTHTHTHTHRKKNAPLIFSSQFKIAGRVYVCLFTDILGGVFVGEAMIERIEGGNGLKVLSFEH